MKILKQIGSADVFRQKCFILFAGIWFLSYLIYPSWLLPVSPLGRLLIFISFLAYFSFNSYLLYRWTDGLVNHDKNLLPFSRERIVPIIKGNIPFIMIAIFYVALHIYLMTFPIMSRSDEQAHVVYPLGLMAKVSPMIERYSGLSVPGLVKSVVVLSFVGLVVWVLISSRLSLRKKIRRRKGNVLKSLSLICLGLVIVSLEFYLLRNFNFAPSLVRFPPLGKLLYILSYSFLGISEVGVRLVQLILTLLTGLMLMRLINLFGNKRTAFLAASMLLFFPSFFYYSNLAELTPGALFFTVISSFYFLRYLKEERSQDLLSSVFWVSTGFLYKRPLAVMLPIFWVFLFARGIQAIKKGQPESIKLYLKISWIALVPILPWLVIGAKFVYRNYYFTPANWFSMDIMTRYLRQMPSQMTLPLFILFLAGIFYGLVRTRDVLTKFSFVWFLGFYIFFSLDSPVWIPVQRYSLYLYPASAIIITQLAGGLITKAAVRKMFPIIYSVLIGYLILCSTVLSSPPVEKQYVAYKDIASRFLPYDKAVYYVKQNLPEDSKVLATMGPNPLRFYLYKFYGCHPKALKRWVEEEWTSVETQNLDNLYRFVLENGIGYVLFPTGHWLSSHINEEMVESLVAGRDKRFKMVETFVSGENRMHLWKVVNGESWTRW